MDSSSKISFTKYVKSNLVPENRYRLNCTLFNETGELYWLGKMMTVTEMDIIF